VVVVDVVVVVSLVPCGNNDVASNDVEDTVLFCLQNVSEC
jgi:hypothetical protein